MKPDFKIIAAILSTGSLMGLLYNFISPHRIPLIAEEKRIMWADDSLFTEFSQSPPDTIIIKGEDKIKTGSVNNTNAATEKDNEKAENKITNTNPDHETLQKKETPELTEPAAINLSQAYSLYKQNVLFIDAREPVDFEYAHIKNAINIPADHFDDYKHILDKINKERTVVTYCGGSDCDLSIVLGNLMLDLGYRKVYIFFGGWNEWLEANYPIKEGTQTQ